MSVHRSERTVSKLDFLATARKLESYTIRQCVKFPKRYTFYIGVPLGNAASRVHEDVKKANSIYPVNQHEAQMRRDYLIEACAELNAIVSKVELANETFPIEMDAIQEWMRLVHDELKLIKGVLKSDKERFKALPD